MSSRTLGRGWPLLTGERGEYALLVGPPAEDFLATIARSGNEGLMLPEQVWNSRPPTSQPGYLAGEAAFPATPLTWTHAQSVRLAWSIQEGRPVERPSVVSCRDPSVCR